MEAFEQLADALPGSFDGSLVGLAQEGFEFGKDLLDRVEVWAVGRQEEELCIDGADGSTHGHALVTAEIVHNDDVAGRERRHEDLLDIGQEALAVDRPVDNAGCVDPVRAQGCQEGQRPPASMWRLSDEPFAASAMPMGARHVGLDPGLVDEDQASWIEFALMRLPAYAPPGDVRPVLLGCVQAFF